MLLGLLCFPAVQEAWGRGTPAGSSLSTAATATFRENGKPVTVTSNAVTLYVQEVLDVTVQPGSDEPMPAAPGETGAALPFVLTNIGNGPERFELTTRTDLGGDKFDPACPRLVLDANANQRFDPSTDAIYVPGANDPLLRPDQPITIFAVCDLPASDIGGDDRGAVLLSARARTGTGTPGTLFNDPEGNGIHALAGTTGGKAAALHGFRIAADAPTITKAQHVRDANGGTNPVPGASVTYVLTAEVRSGRVANAVINDLIPLGTTYEIGSLRLDDVPLTDPDDGDAGRADARAIEVRLGELAASTPRIVSFTVKINQ